MEKVIQESVKQIPIWQLKDAAVRSLRNFANKQYNTLFRALGLPSAFLMLIASVIDESIPAKQREVIARQIELNYSENIPVGVPLQTYAKQYTEEKLKPVLDELSTQNALDPDDVSGRNSLRNRAEMEVRYDEHLESISKLKEDGNKLVVASSHTDCSQRCSPWQGRVYSLDGTSGTTPDGRKFVPLEEATDIYYTTKAGRTYKNGLLGFNCYDDVTEVLTNNGWKLFQELTIDDLVYTLNITTKISEWQKPIAYYKKYYVGNMVSLQSETSDILVTPDHNILFNSCKNKKLRFKQAKDWTIGTLQYAGQNWNGKNLKEITIGKVKLNAKLFCKLMAYYLADGSIHSKNSIKIAQQNNSEMFNELKLLPFKVWHDDNKIVIHSKGLHDYCLPFGKCNEKYIPNEIKELSVDCLKEFIDGYLKTDGYISKPKTINGYMRKPHKTLFTTSKQMMADLCEIILKCGYRPSVTISRNKDKLVNFRNGKYKLNYDLYIIHLNYRTVISKVKKNNVEYTGFVYCVEVPNHTLLVKRNGKIQWCGNCRHYLMPYKDGLKPPKPNKELERKEREITQRQRELERNVRLWRTRALEYKNVDYNAYRQAKEQAIKWNKYYIEFSKNNGRAYYPSRTKLI